MSEQAEPLGSLNQMGRVEGRTAVITGAAGELGATLARRFADEGAEALGLIDIETDSLERLVKELASRGSRVATFQLDVSNEYEMNATVDSIVEEFGRLDIMVNNAGILSPNARLHNVEASDFRRVLETNVTGTFNGIVAAVRHMRQRREGVIINTASVAGITAWTHAGPYCASKAAVIQLTKVAAVEYAADAIRVNCVCPGAFESGMLNALPKAALESIVERHPISRIAAAEDIVGAFIYLASDEARWVTGSALVVDGGYSAP